MGLWDDSGHHMPPQARDAVTAFLRLSPLFVRKRLIKAAYDSCVRHRRGVAGGGRKDDCVPVCSSTWPGSRVWFPLLGARLRVRAHTDLRFPLESSVSAFRDTAGVIFSWLADMGWYDINK